MARMKRLIALLTVVAAPAQAESWRKVASNQQGVDYYVREMDAQIPSSLTPTIWVKTDNSREADARWPSSLTQLQVDCVKRNLQLFATYAYDAAGKVKESQMFPLGQRRHTAIPAGSVWAEVARTTCPR